MEIYFNNRSAIHSYREINSESEREYDYESEREYDICRKSKIVDFTVTAKVPPEILNSLLYLDDNFTFRDLNGISALPQKNMKYQSCDEILIFAMMKECGFFKSLKIEPIINGTRYGEELEGLSAYIDDESYVIEFFKKVLSIRLKYGLAAAIATIFPHIELQNSSHASPMNVSSKFLKSQCRINKAMQYVEYGGFVGQNEELGIVAKIADEYHILYGTPAISKGIFLDEKPTVKVLLIES